ncbi:MAG: hypothetical protein ACJ76H_09720 [Bacteriovoracaceae bacterium]
MKILCVFLCLGLMVLLAGEAVELHKLTVCRQEAWRSSVTLHTRSLLSTATSSDKDVLLRCRILVSRNEKEVSWLRLKSPRKHSVELSLIGKL